ncbi:MAG: type 1 glutamine amidotransferase domain-containing protein [Rudaea sp.]
MKTNITDAKIVILATNGFEESELTEPIKALKDAGAVVQVIAPEAGEIQGFRHFEKGATVRVDKQLADARAKDYDALVLPGGLANPDALRVNASALDLIREFARAGKVIAAICHAPWLLADAGLLNGRTMTSVPTIRKDMENAGAKWLDEPVVVDNGFVTSRTPKDLAAFNAKLIEEISEGRHQRKVA